MTTDKDLSARLLPCPFCGGEADIDHDHTVEENHAYGCRRCGLWFDTFNSDDAIAEWNTRTPSDHQRAVQDAVAKAVEAEAAVWREAIDQHSGVMAAKYTAAKAAAIRSRGVAG